MGKSGRPASQLYRVLGAVIAHGGGAGLDPAECWPWDEAPFFGELSRDGYGVIRDRRNGTRGVHRLAWRWHHKVFVPEGCEVDHLCRRRSCVNPAHLDAVDQYGNSQRQRLTAAQHRALGPATLQPPPVAK